MFVPPLGYSKPDMETPLPPEKLPPPPASEDAAPAPAPPPASEDAPADPEPFPARRPRWLLSVLIGILTLLALILTVGQMGVPFYALSPGPVEEVDDITDIAGAPVYDLHGDLYMLTVTLQEVNFLEFVQGWFTPAVDLYRTERIRPPDVTPEEHRERNRQMMRDSRDVAVTVALRHLGYEVGEGGEGVLVLELVEGSPAAGAFQPGDVITAVDGEAVSAWPEGVEAIRSKRPGQDVEFTFTRGSEERTVRLTLMEHPAEPGRPMAGFTPGTANPYPDAPFDVTIDTANSGGPSAGIMYALTILDLLTEEDMIKGNIVAGTGSMDLDGNVGPIGGVRQKVAAAQQSGARYILVPAENYADALTAKNDEVEIFAIASLRDALRVLEGLPPA